MSTVPRRAGGTTFFRHVHLKAGIEVPRAPLVAYGKERCARAAPREERGPGAPLPPPRGHGHAVCTRMHSRAKNTSAAGDAVLPRVAYVRRSASKTRISAA